MALVYNEAFKKRLSYEVVTMDSNSLERVMQLIRGMEPRNLIYNKKRRCFTINFANLSQYVLGGIKKILTAFREQEEDAAMAKIGGFLEAVGASPPNNSANPLPRATNKGGMKRTHSLQPAPELQGGERSFSSLSLGLSPRGNNAFDDPHANGTTPTPSLAGPNLTTSACAGTSNSLSSIPASSSPSVAHSRQIGSGVPLTNLNFQAMSGWNAPPAASVGPSSAGRGHLGGAANGAANAFAGINMNYRQYPSAVTPRTAALQNTMLALGGSSGSPMKGYGGFTPNLMMAQDALAGLSPRPQRPSQAAAAQTSTSTLVAESIASSKNSSTPTTRSKRRAGQVTGQDVKPKAKQTRTVVKRSGKAKSAKVSSHVCSFILPETNKPCGASFNRRSGLLSHMRTHTGEKPYPCSICGKRFPNSSNRNAHMRSHSKIKPYKCNWPGCDKAYTHSTSLKEHQCSHDGTYLHKCPDCGKTFTINANYKRHRAKVNCKAKLMKQTKNAKI